MSHELRTPLNGLFGYADELDDVLENPHERELLTNLKTTGDQLVKIVDGVLEFARLESGDVELNETYWGVDAFVRELHDLHQEAEAKKLSFKVDTRNVSPVWKGDSVRLLSMVRALIDNAIRFTDTGTVSLTFAEEAHGLRITVEDDGAGFDTRTVQLGAPLSQGDMTSSKKHQGVGLGLALTSRSAQLMGGQLSLESTLGEGTTASLEVELERGEACSVPVEELVAERNTILVIEDNKLNRRIAGRMVKKAGYELLEAVDGVDGTQKFIENHHRLFAVLMDCQMPIRDGYLATLCIRAVETSNGLARTPIIAVTANAIAGDKARCILSGMDEYMSKPVKAPALSAVLAAIT